MKKSEKKAAFFKNLHIILAILLFFTMLISCGMFIDIRINGRTSSLPPIPQFEKQALLKTGAAVDKINSDNMLEPVFIGIKEGDTYVCPTFEKESRLSMENLVNPVLFELFSGTSEKLEFGDESQQYEYIKQLTETDKFVLISYYNAINASAFLPCLSNDYEITEKPMYFNVKNIFLLSDDNKNVYAAALSEDYDVYILRTENEVSFDKFSAKEYDVSDGYSRFSFSERETLQPVMTSSFVTGKFSLQALNKKYGKEPSSVWVNTLFDVFSLNSSFVKNYSSKNDTEMIYVDDEAVLLLNDDGFVEYKTDSDGVSIEKYLGYAVDESEEYSFSDKIFAVKNLINTLNPDGSEHGNCITGSSYDEENDKLSVYVKSFVYGVSITENEYDAVFEISKNNLVYAAMYAFRCTSSQEYSVCLNQKYVNELFDDSSVSESSEIMYYPLLEKETDGELFAVNWARRFVSDEEV